jgi:hypothetical protein
MGGAKQAQLEQWDRQESGWQRVAESKGFKCELCGAVPSYCEKEIFFDTGS